VLQASNSDWGDIACHGHKLDPKTNPNAEPEPEPYIVREQ
jgi:hypothetical protein